MKRALTIAILCCFLGYCLVLFSAVNALGTNKIPYLSQKLKQARLFAGAGSLFTREVSLNNYATLFRCHQNNKWGKWQQMEKPLFNAYVQHFSLASLKHNRLAIHLSQRLYFNGYLTNKQNFTQTEGYRNFMAHLIYAHNGNIRPDSVEIVYQIKIIDSLGKHLPKTLMRFKATP